MSAIATRNRFLVIVVLLAILSSGLMIHAQEGSTGCAPLIPQWVTDRQQYEPSYIYVPSASTLQAAQIVHRAPRWVIDRQQYETNYVYVPPTTDVLLPFPHC